MLFPTSQPTLVVHLFGPAENVSPPDVITTVDDLVVVVGNFVEKLVDMVRVGLLLISLRLWVRDNPLLLSFNGLKQTSTPSNKTFLFFIEIIIQFN